MTLVRALAVAFALVAGGGFLANANAAATRVPTRSTFIPERTRLLTARCHSAPEFWQASHRRTPQTPRCLIRLKNAG